MMRRVEVPERGVNGLCILAVRADPEVDVFRVSRLGMKADGVSADYELPKAEAFDSLQQFD